LQEFRNHPRSAAHTDIDPDGADWAVKGTGAAFHATVKISDIRFICAQDKYMVRTHFGAHAAPYTCIPIQLDGCDFF